MKLTITLLGIAAGIAIGMYFLSAEKVGEPNSVMPPAPIPTPQSGRREYRHAESGLTFLYPDSYFMIARDVSGEDGEQFSIVIAEDTAENRAVFEGTAPAREGPTAVTFDIFKLTGEDLPPAEWARITPASNFHLSSGTPAEATLGGMPAIRYRWSGLYEAESLVTLREPYIVMASVTYITPDDPIRTVAEDIIESVSFR